MKILIPVLDFGRAGGYRVLSQLANLWISQGHEVDFLCPSTTSTPYFPTVAKILRVNIYGHLVEGSYQEASGNRRGIRAHKYLLRLYLGLCSVGCDYGVILANHSLTAWPVALARCGSARKFYYIQAYEPEYYELETGWRPRVLGWLSIASYKFPLKQVCNAPVYIGYKGIKAKDWVPPGVDSTIFFPKTNQKELRTASEIVVGCIGRNEPAKGISFVLEAFEILWNSNRRFRLRVAYGNLPQGWSHCALEIVVPANDRELGEYYRSLDIMIAPGTVQLGAPHYPVIEAMACAVPLVTTGYIPASNENSWIVPVGDAQAIAAAVDTIVNSPPIVIQSQMLRATRAVEEFRWETVSQKFLHILGTR